MHYELLLMLKSSVKKMGFTHGEETGAKTSRYFLTAKRVEQQEKNESNERSVMTETNMQTTVDLVA
jgi:hypothetical protein